MTQSNPVGLMLKRGFSRFKKIDGVIVGLIDENGDDVTIIEIPWATLTNVALTDPADYAGLVVWCPDKHQDSAGTGGIYVTGGSKWTLVSPHVYFSDLAAAPAASAMPGLSVLTSWGRGGLIYDSNGVEYIKRGGLEPLHVISADTKRCIFPASTWTITSVTDNADGTVTLNGGGAHSLTAFNAVTTPATHVEVVSGTGWTAGWWPIASLPSGDNVMITIGSGNFNASNIPTVRLAGTFGTIHAVTIPRWALSKNGGLQIDTTYGMTASATSAFTAGFSFGGTIFNSAALTPSGSHINYYHEGVKIRNKNAFNSQIVPFGASSGNNANQQENGQTAALATAAIDTSAGDVTLGWMVSNATPKNVYWIQTATVWVF